jgi:hypothetical protein
MINAIYEGESLQVLEQLRRETRFFIATRYGKPSKEFPDSFLHFLALL